MHIDKNRFVNMHITCITPYMRIMHVWMYKTYCTYVPSLPALSCLHMSMSSWTNAVCVRIYTYIICMSNIHVRILWMQRRMLALHICWGLGIYISQMLNSDPCPETGFGNICSQRCTTCKRTILSLYCVISNCYPLACVARGCIAKYVQTHSSINVK